jgi:hypothetical protein
MKMLRVNTPKIKAKGEIQPKRPALLVENCGKDGDSFSSSQHLSVSRAPQKFSQRPDG